MSLKKQNEERNATILKEFREDGLTLDNLAIKYFMTRNGIYAILRTLLDKSEFQEINKRNNNSSKYPQNGALEPRRATRGSAGYDFIAPFDILIRPHSSVTFDTGVRVSLDDDKVMLLFVRSSLGINKGITLANGTGVIDSDYRDTIKCKLVNNSVDVVSISKGDRYMQGVIVKYFLLHGGLDDTDLEKRAGGIGSTGN